MNLVECFVPNAFAIRTSLPESEYASGLSRTEFTTVNMETLPPIPMLRERTAVAVKPGAERRARKASRRSSINIESLLVGCLNGSSDGHVSYQPGKRFDSLQEQ